MVMVPDRSLGATLLEMLVALLITVILLTTAAPGFVQMIEDNRLVAATNQLVAALSMARSEAIKRGTQVTLCKSRNPEEDPPTCDQTASWEQGMLLFVDMTHEAGNQAGVVDGSDEILRVFSGASGIHITSGSNYGRGVSYLPNGLSKGIKLGGSAGFANDTFTICGSDGGRKVTVNKTGRARIEGPITC